MPRVVVIAEKPSVGKELAKVLGCRERGDGFVSNDKYIVTWAVGHLVALSMPNEIDAKYQKWDKKDLPILPESIPLKVITASRKQYEVVKKLMNDKDTASLICATDAGREGELIFRYIYIMAKCKKSFQRLWISSLTEQAIRDGFRDLQPGSKYDNLFESARCRSEADWLVGMNASRGYSLAFRENLHFGRVQTPTLALLVRRKQDIENFVSTPYASLTADFGDYKGVFFSDALNPDTHIVDKKKADGGVLSAADIARALGAKVNGKNGTVILSETQRKKEQPPQLYDLTSLQRDANKEKGFTAEQTLNLAQSLYEKHKALTYPRTDSRYLPPDMISKVKETFALLPKEYKPLVSGAMPGGKLNTSSRTIDASKVSDHHAIIPTAQTADMEKMNANERALFDMVVRRTLAAFYPPFVYDATKIITEVDGKYQFRTTGRSVVSNGWRDVNAPTKVKTDDDENDETSLPTIKKGETRAVKGFTVKEGMTKPPAPYTDASLLTAMETAGGDSDDEEIVAAMKGHGIGTPATRASIIESLVKNKYVERKGKALNATQLGVGLIAVAPQEITSAELTGKWEYALNLIAEGKRDAATFMESINRFATFLVNDASSKGNKMPNASFGKKSGSGTTKSGYTVTEIADLECPLCHKGHVVHMVGKYNFFKCSENKGKDSGCAFVLYANALERHGGPIINEKTIAVVLSGEPYDAGKGLTCYYEPDKGLVIEGGTERASTGTGVKKLNIACPNCHAGQVVRIAGNGKNGPYELYKCSDDCGLAIFADCLSRKNGPAITEDALRAFANGEDYSTRTGSVSFESGSLLYTDNEGVDSEPVSVISSSFKKASSAKKGSSAKKSYGGNGGRSGGTAGSGLKCPLCGKGTVRESDKNFYCSNYKTCKFQVWKNAFERCGGSNITITLLKNLLEKKRVKANDGSVFAWTENGIEFYKSGEKKPAKTAMVINTYSR